ncbi:hypothetical protein EJ02DRAFT_406666 [Clathrospora elynae]|uniref:Transcription factor BYE1 n=1 Tax=Clathrospora elynae TaxID=706981 RepID=A0A6A5SL59_9PLEO|nr:hypothetical protein EJ02DRAFT_406666 [Clathrospora elynae]
MAGKQTPPIRVHGMKQSRTPHDGATRTPASNPHANATADAAATEEIRRSGRANKGHHTKNQDVLDEPSPASKAKAQPAPEKKGQAQVKKGLSKGQAARAQSTPSADAEEEEEDAVIRCVCGDQRDIRGRQMICCDICTAWQHNKCLALPEGDFWEGKDYYCEQCRPEDHEDLLAAMARGERPWARKKGSKAKPRPSDIKQETASEKARTPRQSATPSQPPPPAAPVAPAEAPSPTPAPVAVQTPDAANGHEETNSSLQSNTKSQPQSPLGEKRRHEPTAEKANASKKRQKSSHQEAKPTPPAPQSAPVGDIDALPQNQKVVAEKLRETLAPLINTASDARGYRIPDGQTAKSLATKYTLQMGQAALEKYDEPTSASSPYFAKMRTIMFNVKKNTVLVDRLLSGSLTAQDLVGMEAEEMASEDKQREYAAMREAAEKQMILTEDTGPRLRKTHKGEEIVGEDNFDNDEFKQPSVRERDSTTEDTAMQSPMGTRPPESPADATRAPLSVDTSQPDSARRPSTNFDINSVFDKVRSPQHDQQAFIHRRQSSMHMQDQTQAAVDDADVDRLLKDDDNDIEMSGYSSDPTVCWQGSLHMQSMEPFDAVARFVAGGDFGQIEPWEKLLTNAVSIQGRIESAKGNDYIQGIATTESHEVAILAVSPVTADGRAVMDHLYTYFQTRGRWGVVPVDNLGNDILRDLYVIPIEEGGSNLPPFIDMLEHCTIETPRKEHMLLLALVAKLPEVKPPLPPTQHYERYPSQEIAAGQIAQPIPQNGPSPSPVPNPHAPQFSPVTASYPQPQYGTPFGQAPVANMNISMPAPQQQQQPTPPVPAHHQIPKALEILGPYIDAHVIKTILGMNISSKTMVSELQMNNLRHIMDTVPEARENMTVLTEHLRQKGVGNGPQSGTS